MVESKSLCSLAADGEDFFLFTTTREEEEGAFSFKLILTDTINAWTGSLSTGDMKRMSKKTGEDITEFMKETKIALTRKDVSHVVFEYQVKSVDDGCRELAWKRVMQDESIKFQLGSVILDPADDPSEHMRALLTHSINEIASSQKKTRHLECEKDRLSSERTQALKRLEKCVELKEELDKDHYSKFCVILNEKKSKIRQMQQLGRDAESRDKSEPPSVKNEDNGSLQGSEEIETGEDEDDMSTDEENEMNKVSSVGRRMKKQVIDEDTSLILEEEEEKNNPTTSHGRRRKRKPDEKPAVSTSKPSIPRVPSTPKNTSTPTSSKSSRAPSLRKTPSSTRKGRSADLDASDLFDEM